MGYINLLLYFFLTKLLAIDIIYWIRATKEIPKHQWINSNHLNLALRVSLPKFRIHIVTYHFYGKIKLELSKIIEIRCSIRMDLCSYLLCAHFKNWFYSIIRVSNRSQISKAFYENLFIIFSNTQEDARSRWVPPKFITIKKCSSTEIWTHSSASGRQWHVF